MPENKCKDGKVPEGKNGRCIKNKSLYNKCKDGKVPEGKNGRCIKSNSKTCKIGKVPEGKNGRCITEKNLSTKMSIGSIKLFTPEKDKDLSIAREISLKQPDTIQSLHQKQPDTIQSLHQKHPDTIQSDTIESEYHTPNQGMVSKIKNYIFPPKMHYSNEMKEKRQQQLLLKEKRRQQLSFKQKRMNMLGDINSKRKTLKHYNFKSKNIKDIIGKNNGPMVQNKKNPNLVYKNQGWFGKNAQPKIVTTKEKSYSPAYGNLMW